MPQTHSLFFYGTLVSLYMLQLVLASPLRRPELIQCFARYTLPSWRECLDLTELT